MPLKYLSNFWRSCKIPLINPKAESKLRWTNQYVLSIASTDNANGKNNENGILFAIKDTKLYIPLVTLSARDNQKLSKRLSKGSERSVYWNEYKTKFDTKNTANKFIFLLESKFEWVNRLFVLVYSNEDAASKRYYLPKGIITAVSSSVEKTSWSRNWFIYKMIWRIDITRWANDIRWTILCDID